MNAPGDVVDATGLLCPLPVLKLRRSLRGMAAGQLVTLRATDPNAVRDVPDFCHTQGHDVVETAQEGEVLTFVVRKGGGVP